MAIARASVLQCFSGAEAQLKAINWQVSLSFVFVFPLSLSFSYVNCCAVVLSTAVHCLFAHIRQFHNLLAVIDSAEEDNAVLVLLLWCNDSQTDPRIDMAHTGSFQHSI